MDIPTDIPAKNLLTFDIEDWFHILNCPQTLPQSKWRYFDSRVESSTLTILDLLDQKKIHATFFVLGWIAEHYPDLVREIDRRGHEIGSHGYQHQRVDQISPESFRRDVATSLECLTALTSQSVQGYRAPGFSIHPACYYALDTLAELGFTYDSSIFPARHTVLGDISIPTEPGWIKTPSGYNLFEVPATPTQLAGKSLYLFGGGYFRLAPAMLTRQAIKSLNKTGKPALIYLHPREFDSAHPRLRMNPYRRFTSYVNIHSTQKKLEYLLDRFEFGRINELSLLKTPQHAPIPLLPEDVIPAF